MLYEKIIYMYSKLKMHKTNYPLIFRQVFIFKFCYILFDAFKHIKKLTNEHCQ